MASRLLIHGFLILVLHCMGILGQTVTYDVRLVNGSSPNVGRVEVRVTNSSTWKTICGSSWDLVDGSAVCRQLGFDNATSVSTTALYGAGTGEISTLKPRCGGNETRLDACPMMIGNEGDNCQHSMDAGVVCYSAATTPRVTTTVIPPTTIPYGKRVRLVGGNSPFQGRVEILVNNVWGTICDDSWDTTDARVVCRQLGFKEVHSATTNARFGQGTGPIHMDDTRCFGSETNILDCINRGPGMHNCRHSEDAGVVCLPDSRLVGGSNSSEGRVEIKVGEQWGTVCNVGFDEVDANVVCNQLGFGSSISVVSDTSRFGTATGPVLIKDLDCNSNFQLMFQCSSASVVDGDSQCSHASDVGVVCSTSTGGARIRLVGGNNVFEGRVEVSINNTWGTVCDDYWDLNDGKVVCRQLGLGRAVEVRRYASFGSGFGPIHMDDVGCDGTEESILDCSYNNQTACSHREDAGVVCAPKVRLMGGKNSYQGRVEMFVNDEWGTVCDENWGSEEARVTCRQLKYGYAATATTGASFGPGTGEIIASNIACSGYEGSLVQCSNFGINVNTSCGHDQDAGVICSLPENNITLNLVGGKNSYEGRIEILLDNVWGTVCDNNWDKQDARVVCRQLGLGPGIEAPRNSSFGRGKGPIYVDNLACRGHESSISLCSNNGVEIHNCTHEHDAGVVCSAPIRLVDGANPYEGRVEVLKNNIWGTVCDDSWDIADANVVCKELGFGAAKRAVPASYFGSRSYGSIHFDEVQCTGTEETLMDCPHQTVHDCTHLEDAGAVCSGQKLVCHIPTLPPNTYMSIIKTSYQENEIIAIICRDGNNSVEWTCGQDKMWTGPSIVCEKEEGSDGHSNTAVIVGVVAIFIGLILVAIVVLLFLVVYRNQKRQNFGGGPVTMSDVLAHIDSIRNSGNSRTDGRLVEGSTAIPEKDLTTMNEEPFRDHSMDPSPFYDDKDSRAASTGGYRPLIED